MGKKSSSSVVCNGNINTALIYDTHVQIKEIVESYKEVNLEVSLIKAEIEENWVGKGSNEFQAQYNILMKKMDDFGDTLQDIYEALVEAEASYEDTDDKIRQEITMSMKGGK